MKKQKIKKFKVRVFFSSLDCHRHHQRMKNWQLATGGSSPRIGR
jgi:hypothetical protein